MMNTIMCYECQQADTRFAKCKQVQINRMIAIFPKYTQFQGFYCLILIRRGHMIYYFFEVLSCLV